LQLESSDAAKELIARIYLVKKTGFTNKSDRYDKFLK